MSSILSIALRMGLVQSGQSMPRTRRPAVHVVPILCSESPRLPAGGRAGILDSWRCDGRGGSGMLGVHVPIEEVTQHRL